jgi:hypothetical protein
MAALETVGHDVFDALSKERDELHQYCRSIYQWFLSWFTFFATFNFTVVGWLFARKSEEALPNDFTFVVAGYFVFQNVLGLLACWRIDQKLKADDARMMEINEFVRARSEGLEGAPPLHSAAPTSLLRNTIAMIVLGLCSTIALWLWVAARAYFQSHP